MVTQLYDSYKLKIYTLKGAEFQQFFERIYQHLYGVEFQPIKPHGRLGDGGNDGWIPNLGHYFQVYGPEDFNSKIDVSIKKMKSDFSKIMEHWDNVVKVKSFTIVVNDNFKNCPAPLSKALQEIKIEYGIETFFTGAEQLWFEFNKLDFDTKRFLLGNPLPALPPDVISVIKIIEDGLELWDFPLMNENLISCGLHFSLVEKIPNLSSKLSYYTIPSEYAEINDCINNVVYWANRVVNHFTEYEYCELQHNSILSKTKSWKQVELPPNIYNKYAAINDEWELKHQKLCNNFSYSFNKYLVLIRRIYDSNYLNGFFAFDIFYDTPSFLVDI
ncbi:hypothetical protein [Dickeya zeae]|uniref:hypothetical protein n=1 Tax=Dickeya zeae TaxID=204042 RepID=UPI001440200A|nr:hypothetical protein [Dickeya zeae]QIZ46823.1 hypothetical protein DWV07_08005 [Dickeya zeae]